MKPVKAALAVCAVGLLAAACGQSSPGSTNVVSGGTFTASLSSDPGNLDPLLAQQTSTHSVDAYAYDTLVSIALNGTVQSELASSWKVTPTSVTYTLRKDVTCSDGHHLTASDVAANFTFVKNPANKSSVLGVDLPSPLFTVSSDDSAGTVTVTNPTPYAFLLEGAGSVPIVCPKGLADPAILAHGTDGTGPFTLTNYVAGSQLTLTARKDYVWGPGGASTNAAGFPSKVVLKVIANNTTAENLFLAGQLNLIGTVGPDSARLQGHNYQTSSIFTGPEELWFNERSGFVGADPTVRKALTAALNLDQLAKVVTSNTGERATGLVVAQPALCATNTVGNLLPASSATAAETMLTNDGWVAGANGVRSKAGKPLAITLLYPVTDSATDAAMELISQWWKQVGIAVTLKAQDANAFIQTLFTGSVWQVAWLADSVSNPEQLQSSVSGPTPPTGMNFAKINNPSYQQLSGQALTTPGQAGCSLWNQAEEALLSNVDVLPVANNGEDLFANGAHVGYNANGIEPTSLRMLAS